MVDHEVHRQTRRMQTAPEKCEISVQRVNAHNEAADAYNWQQDAEDPEDPAEALTGLIISRALQNCGQHCTMLRAS